MRIVFFGTSAFAVPALRALAAQYTVIEVITQPDRPAGRGQKLSMTPVKTAALELNIPVTTPTRLKPEAARLRELGCDAFVVASYGRIVPLELLDIPRLGSLNIHPSALPLYRGANPISAAIADGRADTAITIMQMDAGLDTGDILLQEATSIEAHETGSSLHDRLAERSAELVVHALVGVADGTVTPVPQAGRATPSEIAATFTRPLTADELVIEWAWPAARIVNMVRAYALKPAAKAFLRDERVKLLATAVRSVSKPAEPGTILGADGDALLVACGDGAVAIQTLVPPGRGPQSGGEYARRVRMESS